MFAYRKREEEEEEEEEGKRGKKMAVGLPSGLSLLVLCLVYQLN